MGIYHVAMKRGLTLENIMLATVLGQLANIGALNQGLVNIVGKNVGKTISEYYKESDITLPSDDMELMKFLIERIIDESTSISEKNGIFTISVETNKCKVCPKGIGRAEIPGSVCPVPSLIASALTDLTGIQYVVVPWDNIHPTRKIENTCVFKLKKEGKS